MARRQQTVPTTRGAQLVLEWLADNPSVGQADVARDCDMRETQLCHVLKGRRQPTLEQAVALESALGVPPRAWLEVPMSDIISAPFEEQGPGTP